MKKSILIASVALSALAAGCAQTFDKQDGPETPAIPGPSSEAWKSDSVQCQGDADCAEDEICVNGACQLRGCSQDMAPPAAPLGQQRYFAVRRDPVVVGASALSTYSPTDWRKVQTDAMSGAKDVAGGNFLGVKPEQIAVITGAAKKLTILNKAEKKTIDLTFYPQYLAAGDVDGDGFDEVVAFGATGEIALCTPRAGTCAPANFTRNGWTGIDVAAGDVDGDGLAEVAFLYKASDKVTVTIWNVKVANAEVSTITARPGVSGTNQTGWAISKLAIGNLDGAGGAELAGLDVSEAVSRNDVHVFKLAGSELPRVGGVDNIDYHIKDLAADDTDGDHKAEVFVLGDQGKAIVYRASSDLKTLTAATTRTVDATATRISLFDQNGDSPLGRLFEGPRLVSGQVMPIAVLTFPPFSRTHSDGIASVNLGSGKSVSLSDSTSINTNYGVSAGYGFGLGKLFKVSVGGGLSWGTSLSSSTSEGISFGSSYSFGARVERYGSEYAGVVVQCGCFAAYTYEVDDDQHVVTEPGIESVPGQKERFTIYSPVGGQTTLWSSKRYNAMAAQVGYLPKIEVPFTIGDPRSYPNEMIALDKSPINPETLLFVEPPTFRTSDVGQVGWNVSTSESETNGISTSHGFSVNGSISAWGANVGANHSRSWSTGNSITTGKNVSFGGNVPAIIDDPSTPEDEYDLFQYSFTPYIYKQLYKQDPACEDTAEAQCDRAAYYVLMYMVRD